MTYLENMEKELRPFYEKRTSRRDIMFSSGSWIYNKWDIILDEFYFKYSSKTFNITYSPEKDQEQTR